MMSKNTKMSGVGTPKRVSQSRTQCEKIPQLKSMAIFLPRPYSSNKETGKGITTTRTTTTSFPLLSLAS